MLGRIEMHAPSIWETISSRFRIRKSGLNSSELFGKQLSAKHLKSLYQDILLQISEKTVIVCLVII